MKFNKTIICLALLSLLANGNLAAAEYSKGHAALQIFDQEGMAAAPRWVMVWVMFMAASFAAGLFFVLRHVIARWVVGGFVVGFAVTAIAPLLGVVVLSGFIALVHIICWSPGLYQLLSKRPFLPGNDGYSAFSIWSGLITCVILFSWIFDIRDAVIYLQHII